ncbi:MAG TPA: amino acid adenylation domain-containing protein [Longimicrobiaceae bacterium]|nr:amino acid adenylation domain-containing protein [Longimicrobiaceae bacterium]
MRLDLLVRLAQETGGAAPDRIRPRASRDPAPLSFGQGRLWLLHQLDPSPAAYTIQAAYRIPRVDAAAMQRALGEVVRRHESLRTTFAEVGGAPVQVVAPFVGFALPVEDLTGLDDSAREAAALRRTADEAELPFDLTAGPLFRPRLLRLGGDDVLLLFMHHTVSDGWSMGVLFREISVLYDAFRAGGESPLPELPVQYADYAAWQHEQERGGALERHLSYWSGRLAGAPALLGLLTDHARPVARTYRGASVSAALPGELVERLRGLGRSEGATLFMVLLGAYQVLLAKYSGSDDVVVGSPVEGRSRREVEELIGFFVNMLVLRTDLSGDPSFREVLRRVRETTLGAYEHQEMPFERLVAALQPERSLSHSPLFQVVFAAETEVRTGAGASAPPGKGLPLQRRAALFDLTLSTYESARGLQVALDYSTELFERPTIERMLGHFRRVLEQAAADADLRLSRLELAGADERRLLLQEWNRTERPYPRELCIHERFEAQVRERPEAVALFWGAEQLTYAELDARANRLAHHLARLGVGPETRVGVLLERGLELIVSILAVLKAGGCYVPLDPGYPAERLELMLADGGVRVLVSRGEPAPAPAPGGVRVVRLDRAAAALAAEPASPVRSGATAENLAYVVYTSGSTGRPKGVMVGHRHVVQLVCETDYVRLGPGDRVAQASNASFDALAFEAWGALLNGATLVGVPRDVLLSPPALREAFREWGVTTLYQTTALLNQLSRELPGAFASLREVLFGGQAVDAESVRRVLRAGGPRRLLHMYGPTETTAWCSWEQVEEVAGDAATVPVGRPTGNARIYLLGAALQPVPVGVPGEAYVGGAGVVRGYLDRPALTAERFVPDPFATEPGARMYRTGDRLRWRTDGRLEFIGRLDEQVKIRGFRIEPGEVESVLSSHAAVRGARVVVREDEPGEKRLVAYVAGEVDGEALRAHLRRTLPEYMLPAATVVVDVLPLTPNGKLDVKALPAPEYAGAAERYLAPRTPVEEVLAGVWAELLGVARVGVSEDFFGAGGHSLLAMRVVSRVREVFSVELPLRAVFEGPTVAELAARVEALRRSDPAALPAVVPVQRTAPLPLSFAQERLWFLERLQPGSALYNILAVLRLGGDLHVRALERALGEVVRRHEALRTTFREVDGAPVQVIAPPGGFALPVEDLSGLAGAGREGEVARRVAEEARRPFDLAAGPLFRAGLLRLGEEEHVLLLCMHHVVSDGWSLGVLFEEMSALYGAYREGAESPLPGLPVQYADYAVWQRRQLSGAALDRQLAYWKDRLAGAPAVLELPTDRPRPPVQTYRGAYEPVELPPRLLERLRGLGRSEGATLYMVLLGAFQLLLSKHAGTDDVVVGSPIAGRTRREVEELIGFFVNTVVLRTDLSGDPGFREVLRRVREVTLGAYEHQEVPFERLVAELQPERSLSHAPLFQVMFTLSDEVGRSRLALSGLRVANATGEPEVVTSDLSLVLAADARGATGALGYNTDLFERSTVRRMVSHLERVLEQVVDDPDARPSRLELLGEAERRLVVDGWNRTEAPYPADRCVHQLFEAQAGRTPEAVALVHGDRSLTYRELDGWADRLAHHLAGLGVGPEVRVGLCLEPGLEMVVSLFAILKAGGAYVPLDAGSPPERLSYVLADCGVALLLTRDALRDRLPASPGVQVVSVDRAPWQAGAGSAGDLQGRATAGNLAYVIYTSGSTGRPKGVAVEHRGICNLVPALVGLCGLGPGSRVLLLAPLHFDASAAEIFAALSSGAALHLPDEEGLLPGEELLALLRRDGITHTKFTPSTLAVVPPAGVPTLTTLVVGGEACTADLVARWGRDRRFINVYGPTEATVRVSASVCVPEARSPSIGSPLPNTRLYVLDGAGRPAPVGVPGELCIGGVQLARGYLGRPALTAERFVPDAFAPKPGARLYRTGDRARWRGDGTLEFLGRLDEQVKVRGFRIEPGEVEAVLRLHPDVADCAVVAREDAPGQKRLVAYVVGDPDAEGLRAHLRRSLPEYMVPAAFVALESLPRTSSGKLDRRALPAPAPARPARRLRPGTGLEVRIAAIWQGLLRVDEVGAEENFFDLGGHSLLLVRLQARLAAELGREVRVVELFQYPTVRSLAARLEGEAEAVAVAVDTAAERGGARQAALGRRLEARRRRDG